MQATAGLLYANEPGALNEGFSDIFAACIENTYKPNIPDNWIIGKDEWSITSLQNNIYFIRIYDQNNHIIKTDKIIKRN